MLADVQLFLCWIALALVSFWLVPGSRAQLRQIVLVVFSLILIFAIAPGACMIAIWLWLVAWYGPRLFERRRNRMTFILALTFAGLPLLLERTTLADLSLIYTLGVAFATLRAIGMLMDAYTLKERYRFFDVGLCLLFIPLYTVGPLESVKRFVPNQFATFPGWAFVTRGLSRICLGLFKTTFVATGLVAVWRDGMLDSTPQGFADASAIATLGFVLLSWVFTYVNFSGFCDIAIGVSRLFGLRITENFNFPFLARSVQEFWKRWHISLGNWITRYLYFPIVAMIGKFWAPFVATFVAFTLIGWWHEASPTWFAWGALHGLGLCVVLGWQQFMRRRHKALYARLSANVPYALAGWLTTMLYVAWVQTFANLQTMERALAMTRSLFGA